MAAANALPSAFIDGPYLWLVFLFIDIFTELFIPGFPLLFLFLFFLLLFFLPSFTKFFAARTSGFTEFYPVLPSFT